MAFNPDEFLKTYQVGQDVVEFDPFQEAHNSASLLYPNVPEHIVKGLIERESGGNPNASVNTQTRHGEARGLGQFIDATASRYIPDWQGPEDSYDPIKNIHGIYAYLDDLQRQTGNMETALGRYLGVGQDRFGTTPEQHSANIIQASQKYVGEQPSTFNVDSFLAGREQPTPQPTKRPTGATGEWPAEPTGEVATLPPEVARMMQAFDAAESIEREPLPVRLGKAWGRSVGGLQRGIGGALELTHIPGVKNLGEAISKDAEKLIEFYQVEDPNFVDSLAEGISSGLQFLVPSVGIAKGASIVGLLGNTANAAKIAAWLGIGTNAVLEASVEAGNTYNTLQEKGVKDAEATSKSLASFGANLALITATNAAGGMFARRGGQAAKKGFVETVKREAVKLPGEMLGEGFQEAGQEAISLLAEEGKIRKEDIPQLFEAGGMGALTAGIVSPIGTISEIQQERMAEPRPEVAPEAVEPTVAPTPEVAPEAAPVVEEVVPVEPEEPKAKIPRAEKFAGIAKTAEDAAKKMADLRDVLPEQADAFMERMTPEERTEIEEELKKPVVEEKPLVKKAVAPKPEPKVEKKPEVTEEESHGEKLAKAMPENVTFDKVEGKNVVFNVKLPDDTTIDITVPARDDAGNLSNIDDVRVEMADKIKEARAKEIAYKSPVKTRTLDIIRENKDPEISGALKELEETAAIPGKQGEQALKRIEDLYQRARSVITSRTERGQIPEGANKDQLRAEQMIASLVGKPIRAETRALENLLVDMDEGIVKFDPNDPIHQQATTRTEEVAPGQFEKLATIENGVLVRTPAGQRRLAKIRGEKRPVSLDRPITATGEAMKDIIPDTKYLADENIQGISELRMPVDNFAKRDNKYKRDKIGNLVRFHANRDVTKVKIIRTEKVVDRKNNAVYDFRDGNTVAMLARRGDGTAVAYVSNKLSDKDFTEAVVHELWGHFGAEKVLASNPKTEERLFKLFERDKDSDIYKDVQTFYGEDAKDDPGLLFREWTARQIQRVGAEMFDADGNLKADALKEDNVVVRIYKAIRDFVKDMLGVKASQKQIDDITKSIIREMPYTAEPVSERVRTSFLRKAQSDAQKEFKQEKVAESKGKIAKTKVSNEMLVERAKGAKTVQEAQKEFIKLGMSDMVKDDLRKDFFKTVSNIDEVGGKSWDKAVARAERLVELGNKRRAIRTVKKFITRNLSKAKMGEMSPEAQSKVTNLLSKFDVAKLTEKKKRELIHQEKMLGDVDIAKIDPKLREQLGRLQKQPLIDFNVEQIEGVLEDLVTTVTEDKQKRKLLAKGREIDRKETVQEMTSQLKVREAEKAKAKDRAPLKRLFGKTEGAQVEMSKDSEMASSLARLPKRYALFSMNAEYISRMLDSWKDGLFTKRLYGDINIGTTEETRSAQERADYFGEELEKAGLDKKVGLWSPSLYTTAGRTFSKIGDYVTRTLGIQKKPTVERVETTLESGKKLSLTRGQRVALFLHSLNEDSVRHLVNGGFKFKKGDKAVKLTMADIDNIRNSITEDESKLADMVHNYFNNIQNEKINETSLRLNGYEIATEENYFPILVDGSDLIGKNVDNISLDDMKTFYRLGAGPEGAGILKSRKRSEKALILEDVFEAVGRVAPVADRYIGLAEPLTSAKALLSDIEGSMLETGHDLEYKELQDYMDRMWGKRDFVRGERIFSPLHSMFVVGKLGLNIPVALKQLASIAVAGTQMDVAHMITNATKTFSPKQYQQYVKEAYEHSPQLRARIEGMINRDIFEARKRGAARALFTKKKGFSHAVMTPITFMDALAVSNIWAEAKHEAGKKGLKAGTDEYWNYVVDRSEDVTRLTQPTFHMKDRSAIMAQPSIFMRSLTMFNSQLNKNFMMSAEAMGKIRQGKVKEGLKDLGLIYLVQPAIIITINQLRRELFRRGKDDDDREVGLDMLKDAISTMTGNFVIFNKIIGNAVMSDLKNLRVDLPIFQTMTDVWNMSRRWNTILRGQKAGKYLTYKQEQEELDRAWKDTERVLSDLGIPLKNAIDLLNLPKGVIERLE